MKSGKLYRIAGPVAVAELDARMFDIVQVGKEKLLGEVIQINSTRCTIQIYEDTTGLKPGDPVINTEEPLSVELGPGMLSSIYDGIQRPLPELQKQMGDFILRGATAPGIDHSKKWHFKPTAKKSGEVRGGGVIGEVMEGQILHRIMVPPGVAGKITEIKEGSFTVDETVCKLDNGKELSMMHKWPVRKPRPAAAKLPPVEPLITGQRIIDALFTISKGGVAAIPGPFGSGKCVTGETPILADNQLAPIEQVFLDNMRANTSKVEESWHETIIELKRPLAVQTFDGERIRPGLATHLYKGKTSQIVNVKTRSGKTVRLTPAHKLFKLTASLDVVETPAGELKPGDFILSPRKLYVKSSSSSLKPLPKWRIADRKICEKLKKAVEEYSIRNNLTKKSIAKLIGVSYRTLLNCTTLNNPTVEFAEKIWQLCNKSVQIKTFKTERRSAPLKLPETFNENFAEFIGYLMSDGMIKGGTTVHFFNERKQLRERFSELAEKLFGLKAKEYYARTVWAMAINSQTLSQLLQSFGYPTIKKSRNITLPVQLLTSPESVVRSFLKAYIVCDGHVGKRDLEITTASRQFRNGLCYLLARLGVLHRATERKIGGGTYYRVFIPPREAVKIAEYYHSEYYYNSTDIVPMTSALFREILGTTKPWQLQKPGISTIAYYKNLNQATLTFQKVAQHTAKESMKSLSKALDCVFCDELAEVEIINEAANVYDLTVADTHNFIGGEMPMILHNTVTQQSLAKWSDADVIVYVGCGERGNEMTEVLTEFPRLTDPKTGKPLLNRTVLIANTSNMPVAAREASIYCGMTMAEYYRDMGYNVAMMADSTSRWAEAMREISSRLEEMPGEEGYPAYLSAKLAEFYERAGRYKNLNGTDGSVSVIGAVSPAGGDFSEPVTQSTLRVVKAFWGLDAKLAQRRHFPAINWLTSYSLYLNPLEPWFTENVAEDWRETVDRVMSILQEEEKLLEIVQLVGSDALPEREQVTLQVARLLREVVLQQNAFHAVDTYSEPKKTYTLMKTILRYGELAYNALSAGAKVADIVSTKSKDKLGEVKFEKDYAKLIAEISKGMEAEFSSLKSKKERSDKP